MPPPELLDLVARLRASKFRDLAGARVTARLPIPEALLNDFMARVLPKSGAVRDVRIHPQPNDRIGVRVKLARPEFLPPVAATLVIERQPELPDKPVLAFRLTGLPRLLVLAGPVLSIGSMLPAGVRLEGDLLTIDLAAMLEQQGQGELLAYLDRIRLNSEAGRLVLEVDGKVE